MKSTDISKLVETVARLTDGLLTTITHATVNSTNSYGEHTYSTAVSRKAFILRKEEMKTRADGVQVATHTQIVIPDAVAVNLNDRIKWSADGLGATESWPIVSIESPLDADGQPYVTQVWLGYKVQ